MMYSEYTIYIMYTYVHVFPTCLRGNAFRIMSVGNLWLIMNEKMYVYWNMYEY